MLKVENLSVRYDQKPALLDLNIEFKPNRITGLIGPNGAGKSTLMKTCIGLITEYKGQVFYSDKNLKKNRFWVKQHAAYTPENAELLPYMTGCEFLGLICAIHKLENCKAQINFMIELTGLLPKQNELVLNYSHGMRQKLSIAAALLPDPEYIFIDETLNGLDSISLKNVHTYLKSRADEDRVIVVSSHNVNLIQDLCDEVYIIKTGNIVSHFDQAKLDELKGTKDAFLNKYISMING